MSGQRHGWAAAAIAILAILSVWITPWSRDLVAGDESRYARIAAEMDQTSDWLLPTLDGAPYTEKPPLHFWAIVILARVLGWSSAWPYVLPSLAAFSALAAGLWFVGRRWVGSPAGITCAIVGTTSLLAWGSAQTARMDASFALFSFLSVVFAREGIRERRGGAILLSGLFCGIAIMIKGPAALVITLLVWLFERIRARNRPGFADLGALLLAALPAVSWIVAIDQRYGGWISFDLLFTQNLGRTVDSFAHAKPVWYYVAGFPAIFFPWFILIAAALIDVARGKGSEIERFAAGWFLLILGFFSLVSGKLEIYLLPAVPAAALLIGAWAHRNGEGRRSVVAGLHAVLLGGLSLASVILAAGGPELVVRPPESAFLSRYPFVPILWLCAGISAAGAWASWRASDGRRLVSSVGGTFVLALMLVAFFMTGFFNDVNSSRPLIQILERRGIPRSMALYEAFHPWGRSFPFASSRYTAANPWTLKRPAGPLPEIVVTRDSRTTNLGRPLREHYVKIGSARIRRKNYDVWELQAPRERRSASN